MITYNKIPYSNQFERGHSFNWAGHWTVGKYYYNNSYVTDFVMHKDMILVCRKDHISSEELEPIPIVMDGEIKDVQSSYWEFIASPRISSKDSVLSSEFVATATEADHELDPNVIVGDPYIKLQFGNDRYTYIPVQQIIQQYKVGVPMLTSAMYDELPEADKPDPYILIPSEGDVIESTNGNYLDILFSAIRSLQAEVAKLKNSFEYGIQSYVGTDTTMSEVVSEYSNLQDEEPLWSVDEEMLSGLEDINIDFKSIEFPPFYPQENISYNANSYAKIIDYVNWDAPDNSYETTGEDTKIFLYLTLTNLDVTVHLQDIYDDSFINLNIASATNIYNQNDDKYNVCIVISRKVILDDEEATEFGTPYIWISVGSFLSNVTYAEGYYNPDTDTLYKYRIELDNSYTIKKVTLPPCNIYKFKGYTKWQDFSKSVIPSKPSDVNYKFKAAHITIRSVDNMEVLGELEDQLLNNELIYVEDINQLWIKSEKGLQRIGGGSSSPDEPTDTGMTEQEMINKLAQMGIIYVDEKGLQISDISDVTFINENTGKKFKFEVDTEGNLISNELPTKSLVDRLKTLRNSNSYVKETSDIRGFVAKLLASEEGIEPTGTGDLRLNSDRLKIGAIYCPLATDTKFGCSYGYIELENTSDKDIPLDNVYLHYLHPNNLNNLVVEHLELSGQIKAGSTYLIRCKKYADPDKDADVFINVSTFDKEWYIDGELLDVTNNGSSTYAFALTFGNYEDLAWDSINKTWVGSIPITPSTWFIKADRITPKSPYSYRWYFIDSLILNNNISFAIIGENQYWGIAYTQVTSNTIIKNTFELDPAKQAYQALTQNDSSRIRLANVTNDLQQLNLNKEFIEFPLSDDRCEVSKFTPKASKENKNVSSDKTKLDVNKPNMVTCSFGIDSAKTRTFNWISCGQFDEFVWIKNGNSWLKFESYKIGDGGDTQSNTYPNRKVYSNDINDTIYARMTGIFPGDKTVYTSHKCVINVVSTAVNSKTIYTYIVGRESKDGTPDFDHCSEEYTFTLYPASYTPKIYQVTDQQGFHWIEYQVWAAAAKKVNETIIEESNNSNIIPVLLNTGDMTQNGTRINEWLDYYNAGKVLFNHLEQVNCVGNNDLCNTDPEILGTGDDPGKSNGYYFHVFYCYDIDETNAPIIVGDDNIKRYIPSLYYIDFSTHRFIIVNSEITYVNCDKWFNKHYNGQVVNIYTGWCIPSDPESASQGYCNNFVSIYSMLYNMMNNTNKYCITACHEMPFTVVTVANLQNKTKDKYRSLNGTSLVGSHLNQLNSNDKKGLHWFSRLLEHFGVKLCLGGHKHTYACTFPLCEYYYYDNETKNSKDDGPMEMESTLENDDAVWIENNINLSKFPLIDSSVISSYGIETDNNDAPEGHFSPTTLISGLSSNPMYKPVVYFMCQATGYKLTSNKELPSNYQHFSRIIPRTTIKSDGSDNPDPDQKYPMFSVITFNQNHYTIKLIRIDHIMINGKFTQSVFSKNTPYYQYATDTGVERYCTWSNSETNLITI